MVKGKVIFLNGVTSTGKTTISKCIQDIADENYYHMSCDMFQQMISNKFLSINYWEYLSEGTFLMYKTAKMMSDNGINVIIDGMLLEMPEFKNKYNKSNYELMKSILDDSNLFIVEVYCPLDECRKRNMIRGDRNENQSIEQNELIAKNFPYNIIVNTQNSSAIDCAKNILTEI